MSEAGRLLVNSAQGSVLGPGQAAAVPSLAAKGLQWSETKTEPLRWSHKLWGLSGRPAPAGLRGTDRQCGWHEMETELGLTSGLCS